MVKFLLKRLLVTMLLCFILIVSLHAQTGTTNGTYNFGALGVANSHSTGFKTQQDKFAVTNDASSYTATNIVADYANSLNFTGTNNNTAGATGTITVKAEGGSTCKRFTLKNLYFYIYWQFSGNRTLLSLSITIKNFSGTTIATHTTNTSKIVDRATQFSLTDIPFSVPYPSAGYNDVAEFTLAYTLGDSNGSIVAPNNFLVNKIVLENISSTLPPTSTTWNGTTWSNGTPTASTDAIIASSTAPSSFTCKALTINSGVSLNTTAITATVNGNIANNGNGLTGAGNLTIAASSTLSGSAISFSGKLTVNSGATLTTADLLTLASDATNTGYVTNSAGSISGNVTVQRFIPSGRRVYRFLSHPFTTNLAMSSLTDNIDITGSGGSPFTTTSTNSSSAFSYDNSIANSSLTNDPGWTALTASSTLNVKTAYRILVRGSKGQTGSLTGGSYTPAAVTLDWTGALNQGSQIITLTNNGTNKAYNFVGNPYASPVDLSLLTRGSNINANFSVWDPNANTRGAYTTQAFTSSYILPSGAAFFTQTSANTNNTITFTEASKSTGTPTALFRSSTTPEDKLVLEVNNANGNYADKLAFYFDNKNNNYTANNDVLWDAEKMANPDANFYSFSKDGIKLAIDRRPLKDNDTIQLGFTNTAIANFSLTVKELPTINTNYDLYVRDKWLNTTTLLKANTSINIEVTNDAASQGNNRFELVTKLNKNLPVLNNKLIVKIYPNPAFEKINISYEGLNDKETTTIKIVDASGRMVQTIDAGKIASGNKIINTKSWNSGMYTFELVNGSDTHTQQIIKQ